MSRRVLVIANASSGRSRAGRALPRLAEALRAIGLDADVRTTRAPGDTASAVGAAAEGARAVVVLGGDGTVREAAEALLDGGPPLTAVPVGTANLLARDLGLPRDPAGTAALVSAGREVLVDVGAARNGAGEERRFLCTAGAGLDGAVVHAVHAGRRGALGFRGWARPLFATARAYAFPRVRVSRADGGAAAEGTTAVICNTRSWGGFLALAPDARVDDGRFDLCAMELDRRSLLPHLWAAWRGTLARRPGTRIATGERFLLESDAEVPVQVDGDPFGTTPLDVRLSSRKARFLVPAEDA